MNYNLTDFSLKELHELSAAIAGRIENKKRHIEQIEHWFGHDLNGPTRDRLLEKQKSGIPELREMHVRVLTSISIVKNSETVNQN